MRPPTHPSAQILGAVSHTGPGAPGPGSAAPPSGTPLGPYPDSLPLGAAGRAAPFARPVFYDSALRLLSITNQPLMNKSVHLTFGCHWGHIFGINSQGRLCLAGEATDSRPGSPSQSAPDPVVPNNTHDSLTTLETRTPKPRHWQDGAHEEGPGGASFVPASSGCRCCRPPLAFLGL